MGRDTKYGKRMLRKLKPFFIQNSIIPRIFSKFAPIEIWAITIFPFVFCRGELGESTKRHETIHFQQQIETGVIFFYLIYLWDYLKLRKNGLASWLAYRQIRAEKEAYAKDNDPYYLEERKRWKWLRRN